MVGIASCTENRSQISSEFDLVAGVAEGTERLVLLIIDKDVAIREKQDAWLVRLPRACSFQFPQHHLIRRRPIRGKQMDYNC